MCVCDICHSEASSAIITSTRLASHTAHNNPLALNVCTCALACVHGKALIASRRVSLVLECRMMCTESVGRIRQSLGLEVRGLECRLAPLVSLHPALALQTSAVNAPGERSAMHQQNSLALPQPVVNREPFITDSMGNDRKGTLCLSTFVAASRGEPGVSEKLRVPLSQGGSIHGGVWWVRRGVAVRRAGGGGAVYTETMRCFKLVCGL